MTYLSVGTNYISPDLFINIKNTDGIKPNGGIWATKYDERIKDYNEWVDFLCTHSHLLYYRGYENPYYLPAIKFNLNENSNVYVIDSLDKINYLQNNYPINNNSGIDYEKLAKDYDCLYININSLPLDNALCQKFIYAYSVNTLIVFNPKCISYYQQAYVDLRQTKLNNKYAFPEYIINIEEEIIQVDKPSLEVSTLIEVIKQYMINNNIQVNHESYDKIKNIFQESIDNALIRQKVSNKDTLLIRKVFNQL